MSDVLLGISFGALIFALLELMDRLESMDNLNEQENDMELGIKVTDKITGFSGIVTGFVQYISGCNQALVAPRVGDDGRSVDSCWFDVQRLVRDDLVPALTLDNGATPGCDRAAPRR